MNAASASTAACTIIETVLEVHGGKTLEQVLETLQQQYAVPAQKLPHRSANPHGLRLVNGGQNAIHGQENRSRNVPRGLQNRGANRVETAGSGRHDGARTEHPE
jgi:hypothetical protein